MILKECEDLLKGVLASCVGRPDRPKVDPKCAAEKKQFFQPEARIDGCSARFTVTSVHSGNGLTYNQPRLKDRGRVRLAAQDM